MGEGRGPGCPVPVGDTVRGPPTAAIAAPALPLPQRRFLCGPAGLGEGEGGTGASQGQGQSQGQHWGHRGVSQHCPTPHPLSPSHRPLTADPSPLTPRLGTCTIPRPPTALGTVPSDSTQQGTVQPLQPSPGPAVPRAGDSGTHLAGGRGGRQGQGAAAPTRGWPGRPGWRSAAVGSGGRAGAALRKFGRGVNYGKGKKIKKLNYFFLFFFSSVQKPAGFGTAAPPGLLTHSTGWGGVCRDILVQPSAGSWCWRVSPSQGLCGTHGRRAWPGLSRRAGASEGTP